MVCDFNSYFAAAPIYLHFGEIIKYYFVDSTDIFPYNEDTSSVTLISMRGGNIKRIIFFEKCDDEELEK